MKEHEELSFPCEYDYYYYNKKILEMMTNSRSVTLFFQKNNCSLVENSKGYLYLLEKIWFQLINEVETLLPNSEAIELICWGNKTFSDPAIQELDKTDPSIHLLLELNQLRKEIAKLRFRDEKHKPSENEIASLCERLKDEVMKVDSTISKHFEITTLKHDASKETIVILNYILNVYNHFDFYGDIFKKPLDNKCWPSLPFAYLMNSKDSKNYHFESEKLKINEKEYFSGFKYSLLYLYGKIFHKDIDFISKKITESKDWFQLHKTGSSIFEKFVRGNHIFRIRLFQIRSKKMPNPKIPKIISEDKHFDLLFRGRDIRLFPTPLEGDYVRSQVAFEHMLFGAIKLHRADQRSIPEVVELAQEYNGGTDIRYSYALYLPVCGTFWDATFWIIFDDVTGENNWEKTSFFHEKIRRITQVFKDSLNFKRIRVKETALKNYLNRRDFPTSNYKKLEDKFGEAKGLSTEFLAGVFLQLKYGAKITDFRKDENQTDADVVAETNQDILLCQAKATFPNEKETISHFDKLTKDLKKQNYRKILFIMKPAKVYDSPDYDEVQKRLKNNGIEVICRDDLESLLAKNKNKGVKKAIDVIYESNDGN